MLYPLYEEINSLFFHMCFSFHYKNAALEVLLPVAAFLCIYTLENISGIIEVVFLERLVLLYD